MSATRRMELEELLHIHKQNKFLLEKQKAQHGIQVPPSIEHGLREANDHIIRIEKELAGLIPDDAIHIDLWTREGANPQTPGAKQLDWTAYFVTNPPTPELWNQHLAPQLRAMLNLCGEHQSRTLAVHAKAHISAAIAFGYMFPTTSPYHLWVEQKPDEWWLSKLDVRKTSPLIEQEILIDANQTESSIELSIVWDIRNDVQNAITELGLPLGRRIQLHLAPPDGIVIDAGHAKAIAEQVREVIKRARGNSRHRPIHLFAAIPVALAVLIGAHLNACGPIQCYEHRKNQGDYVSVCLLQG